MREIYESTGTLVAWIEDECIFDRITQRWVAFLSNELVYAGGGRLLGFFVDSFFRDTRGNAVAFVVGAKSRDIVMPRLQIAVLDMILPPRPIRPVAPRAPEFITTNLKMKMGWSWSWKEFIEGVPHSDFSR